MSAQSFEEVLARLYTDPSFRKSFLDNPTNTLTKCGLTDSERDDLASIDKSGLLLASRSFYAKRKKKFSKFGWLWRNFRFFLQLVGR